jgi:hypothetical protein
LWPVPRATTTSGASTASASNPRTQSAPTFVHARRWLRDRRGGPTFRR